MVLALLVAIVGFTMVTASAASETKTIKIKDDKHFGNTIKIGNGDIIYTSYNSKYSSQAKKSRLLSITSMRDGDIADSKYHRLTKVKITYKNEKTNKLISKIYKTEPRSFTQIVSKGWTPKKATAQYKIINPSNKLKTLKIIDKKVKKVSIGKNDYIKVAYSSKSNSLT